MPGAGKSTIGRRLSARYGLDFIDADTLIESSVNMPIQSIVNNWGLRRFSKLEQEVLCSINVNNCVISTGGSAVYSDSAMQYLGLLGKRVYLRISKQTMLRRINNESSRGLFKLPGHSLMRLYAERSLMYPKYADLTFDNNSPFTAGTAQQLYTLIESSSSENFVVEQA